MMAEVSKCPHCDKFIGKLRVSQMSAEYNASGMHNADSRNCWVFSCPLPACGKIISVQHDPIQQRDALGRAIADFVVSRIRGHQ